MRVSDSAGRNLSMLILGPLDFQAPLRDLYYIVLCYIDHLISIRDKQYCVNTRAKNTLFLHKHGWVHGSKLIIVHNAKWPSIVQYDRLAIAPIMSGMPPHPGPQSFRIQVQSITALSTVVHEMDYDIQYLFAQETPVPLHAMVDTRKQFKDMGLKADMSICDPELIHSTAEVATIFSAND